MFPIVLGFRHQDLAKWSALPSLIFWLAIVTLIWLYLLGWSHLISGHFSWIEIAMTVVIGGASIFGIVTSFRWRTATRPYVAGGAIALFAAFQLMAFRLSLIPSIASQ